MLLILLKSIFTSYSLSPVLRFLRPKSPPIRRPLSPTNPREEEEFSPVFGNNRLESDSEIDSDTDSDTDSEIDSLTDSDNDTHNDTHTEKDNY